MAEHEVAVLVERDELLISPDEGSLGEGALLPVNLAAAGVDCSEDCGASFAPARKIDRLTNPHGVAMMEAQSIRAPQLLRLGRQAIALQFDYFRSRAVLGRDEQQIVGAPYRSGDADTVIGPERYLPLQISIV